MFARLGSVAAAVSGAESGLLVLAGLFTAAAVSAALFGSRREGPGRWRAELPGTGTGTAGLGSWMRRKWAGIVALVGATACALVAFADPEVLVVPFMLVPMMVLFAFGYSLGGRIVGRAVCLVALCAAVPVPLVWDWAFADPALTFAQFLIGAIALAAMLGLEERRRVAGASEWSALTSRIRRHSLGDDGKPVASIAYGSRARQIDKPDCTRSADRFRAKRVTWIVPETSV